MKKQIFKVGDTVYHGGFGEGKVVEINVLFIHPLLVQFAHGEESFTLDGKFNINDIHPTLSLTPYTLQGFSQERPIDYNDYIGKWGRFWDGEEDVENIVIRKLRSSSPTFMDNNGTSWELFQPLSDEAVEIMKKEGIIKD